MLRLDILRSGPATEVCAVVIDNRCETREFLDSLPEGPRRKVNAVLRRLSEIGCAGYKDNVVKHLQGRVFEIKEQTTNRRLFYFSWGRRLVVCTHGGKKPAGNTRFARRSPESRES